MHPVSIAAVYLLFWVLSLFLVLPWGVRTDEEVGVERLPGHAESAPHGFIFWRVALRTTILATILFALFYLNWTFGWVSIDLFDWAAP
jgi:predicted secreted protein